MSTPAPSITTYRDQAGALHIVAGGCWDTHAYKPFTPDIPAIFALIEQPDITFVVLATAHLEKWDSTLATFFTRIIQRCRIGNLRVDMASLPEGMRRLLELALAVPERAGAARTSRRPGLLERIGTATLALPDTVRDVLTFVGEITSALGRLASHRADMRSRDLVLFMYESGAAALPIVSLISLLVGLILAFVGAVQLRLFGAQIYVASLVAIAMVRVMGAIMTGITMAGRTGASYAAILGTMQVNEEVDALATLGLRPVEYLVLPRLLALVVMMPLLTLYADLMGMMGGFIVGLCMLGLSPAEYINTTREAVNLTNVWIGLVHGMVFGMVVALSGCYHGIRCGRSASAVGAATTAAVVSGIVSIIVSTAFITVACEVLGL